MPDRRAIVFLDYDNLYQLLHPRLPGHVHADEVILELLDELRRYLLEETRIQTTLTLAFADFSALSGNGAFIQRTLVMQGIEPRFAPSALQANAAELQICIEALGHAQSRPELTNLVLLTGDRAYLPLLQHLRRMDRAPLLAALHLPPPGERHTFLGEEHFLNAFNLLTEPTRRALIQEHAEPDSTPAETPAPAREPRKAVTYQPITSEAARTTLDIIEEHFGQYEEVYLTPLLRKLSELLDDETHDPKSIINDLEEAGAIWLEKRRGFPYDYTVLIVDSEHPDVQQIQQDFFARHQQSGETYPDYQDDYEYEDYEHPASEYDAHDFPNPDDADTYPSNR
jgi:hypothetical protein